MPISGALRGSTNFGAASKEIGEKRRLAFVLVNSTSPIYGKSLFRCPPFVTLQSEQRITEYYKKEDFAYIC